MVVFDEDGLINAPNNSIIAHISSPPCLALFYKLSILSSSYVTLACSAAQPSKTVNSHYD